ncbi:MAG: hypothetical protein LRY67_01665 [Gammaproteobacteria bacterium]|nr:hypothetical protein [Gammaproteobacteria bacterium]
MTRALRSEYTVRMVSYNAANNDHHDAIAEMASEIFPERLSEEKKIQPAIFIYAGQESVPYDKSSIPDRIIGHVNSTTYSQSPYTTRLYHYQSVFTKPLDILSHSGNARTELFIAFDPTQISPDDIRILSTGKSVDDGLLHFDHKGGVYALLGIRTTLTAVSSVHLDSFDPENARSQLNRLTNTIRTDAHNHYLTIHNSVYIGDFNIRVKRGKNNIEESVHEWLHRADPSLTPYPYPAQTPTYGTPSSPQNKKRPEHENHGRLDHIVYSENAVHLKLPNAKACIQDREPKHANNSPISDHKMIVGDMVIDTKPCEFQHPLMVTIQDPINELERLCRQWLAESNNLPAINLLNDQITLIIEALKGVEGYSTDPSTRISSHVVNIFYCACLLGQYVTEVNLQNNQQPLEIIDPADYFMIQIFKQLLGGERNHYPVSNSLHNAPLERIAFLQPLAKKFKEHTVRHAGCVITRDENDSDNYKLKYLGFFNKILDSFTECEKNNAYFY